MDHNALSTLSTYSNHHFYISDLDVEYDQDNNWIAFGGGIETYQKTINTSPNNGYVALWNLPTRTATSIHLTHESIQCVKYLSENTMNNYVNNRIITLGNEPYVSYWNCYNTKRMERAFISSTTNTSKNTKRSKSSFVDSGYACCVHPVNKSIVVGGVTSYAGSGLSCFIETGHPSFQFSF